MSLLKSIQRPIAALLSTLSVVSIGCFSVALAQQDEDLIPLEYFALRETMQNVQTSPSGEHISLMRIASRDGNPVIEIYDTNDLSDRPVRIGSGRSEIISYQWLNNDRLLVNFRNKFRDDIEDVNVGVYAFTQALVSRTGGRFTEISEFVSVIDPMRTRENQALAQGRPNIQRRSGGTIRGTFGAPELFTINVETGRVEETIVTGLQYGGLRFDSQDRLRGGQTFDPSSRELVLFNRDPERMEWEEFHRLSAASFENFSIAGFDPEDDTKAFVIAHNGNNTTGLYEFDLRTGEYGDLLFRNPNSDILGPVFSSRRDSIRTIIGVSYLDNDGRQDVAYLNTPEAADEAELVASIEAAFPDKEIDILSRSIDDRVTIIRTRSPRDPGTYYLLRDRTNLEFLGQSYPLLEEAALADVEYITYEARDGREIPAYLTIPNGEGPHPLVVLPHGGPWVQEIIVYDEWAQVLASRGYMVLQPQFRGSFGYGLDHWTSSFNQWGMAMQDDLDDGALHLVDRGLADPDRLAMFGWSYGGYASLVASLRSPQIYQCSVAGAPVSDPVRFRANFRGGGLSRIQFSLLEMGYGGVVPEDETANVNIPIMLIHGDLDQRVLIRHSEAFVRGLSSNDKPHRFVVLEGADHFSNTLFYDHQITLFTELTNFLENDCGPGGL